MIKAVIFDMDGVLIDAREWHYEALNRALALLGLEISRADHVTTFDGLSTRQKLEILSTTEGLPRELHGFMNRLKQNYTMEIVSTRCKPVFIHQYALSSLKARGLKLAVASNSVRKSVEVMMQRAQLDAYLDLQLSNEDVEKPKPAPDIYLKAMAELGVTPAETLIVEDNEHGRQAVRAAGAHLMAVREPNDVTLTAIEAHLNRLAEIAA